jgi:hypothetical protein
LLVSGTLPVETRHDHALIGAPVTCHNPRVTSRKILAEIRNLRVEMAAQNERAEAQAERASQQAERSDTLIERIEEELRLGREQRQRSDASHRDQLQITREVIRRNEIAFERSYKALAELAEEVRAQTKAIFALINELRRGGASPAPA